MEVNFAVGWRQVVRQSLSRVLWSVAQLKDEGIFIDGVDPGDVDAPSAAAEEEGDDDQDELESDEEEKGLLTDLSWASVIACEVSYIPTK